MKTILRIILTSILLCAPAVQAHAASLTPEQRSLYRNAGLIFYDGSFMFDCAPDGLSLVGNDNREKIANYLLSSGYDVNVVAAIIGNFAEESGSFNPNELENEHNDSDAGDCYRIWEDGKKTFTGGFGIAQWTSAGRVKELQEFADAQKGCVTDLGIQLRFIVEVEFPRENIDPKNSTGLSLEELVFKVYRDYEAPGSSHWTTHKGKYYNDYDPVTFDLLDQEKTPAAYAGWSERLAAAKAWLESAGVPAGTTGGTNANCVDGGASIANGAIRLAWPNTDGTCKDRELFIEWDPNQERCHDDIKPEELDALTTSLGRLPQLSDAQDCGKFVASVMRGLSIDTEFPPSGTLNQLNYLIGNPKYTEITNTNSTANLRPGDILITNNGSKGHTLIYVGPQANGYNAAEASLNEYTGKLTHIHFFSSYANSSFSIFRLKSTAGVAGTETSLPIGDPESSSAGIGCDPRTVDLGVHDGWVNGKRVDHRLCSIPNLSSTTTQGYASILQKAGRTDLSGRAVLNSRVAGAVYSMVEAAAQDGVELTAGSTFRSFEYQMEICNYENATWKGYQSAGRVPREGTSMCTSLAAKPGYSNHQNGTAIDFTKSKGSNHPMFVWLRANSQRFGFAPIPSEFWHYSTSAYQAEPEESYE